MYNKKEIARLVIFSVVIFTLLLSLFDFGYSKYRDLYSEYNGKVYLKPTIPHPLAVGSPA